MEVVPAPTTSQHGVVADCISHADPRLVERSSRWKSTQRYGIVPFMPEEAAILNRRAAWTVLGVVEDGKAESELVLPGLEMRDANAEFQREFPGDLPGILDEAFIGVVGDVI